MRNARLSLLWYSVARGKQYENSHGQVGSARASPLAFSPIDGQPRHFSDFPKNSEKCEMRVLRCYGTRSHAASSRRNTHRQGGSARASPLAFSPIACQPRRFSPPIAICRSRAIVTWMKIAFIIAHKRSNIVVLFETLKVQSFMLTEVKDCGLLIVVTSSTFLKRKDMFKEKSS